MHANEQGCSIQYWTPVLETKISSPLHVWRNKIKIKRKVGDMELRYFFEIILSPADFILFVQIITILIDNIITLCKTEKQIN
jgi:hypothetical protein